MRRVLATALALALAGALPGIAAAECKCPKLPAKILFGKADHVFYARLVGAELDRAPPAGLFRGRSVAVQGRYELLEVFKGAPDPEGRVFDPVHAPGNCALGLSVGHTYLFYVDQRGRVGTCEGSRRFDGGAELLELRKLAEES